MADAPKPTRETVVNLWRHNNMASCTCKKALCGRDHLKDFIAATEVELEPYKYREETSETSRRYLEPEKLTLRLREKKMEKISAGWP